MAESEAATAVPSENGSEMHEEKQERLDTTPAEKQGQETEVAERQSHSSSEPNEKHTKTEDLTAVEEAKDLERPDEGPDVVYPSGLKVAVIFLALCLSVFLVALVSSRIFRSRATADTSSGQLDHRCSNSSNNRSIQST